MTRDDDRSWLPAFLALAAIWGLSFLLIKLGLRGFGPVHVAFARIALGAITLLVLLKVRGERLPRGRRTWAWLVLVGAFMNTIPFILFAVGETKVSSVVAGIFNAATPLFVLIGVTLAIPSERPTRERATGLLIGFAGVLVVLGPWEGLDGTVLGSLACLGAAACYGVGVTATRHALTELPDSAVAIIAGQLLVATALFAPILPFSGVPDDPFRVDSLLALAGLGAIGTGIAFVLSTDVMRKAGPTTLSTVTYLAPIVSTAAGIGLLGESITWHEPVGAVVVLLGVGISQGRIRLRRRVPAPA